jgi:hypothetical protein
VAGRGVVIQVELEGSESEARLHAAAAIRGCESETLPIVHIKTDPPPILRNGRANPAFADWTRAMAKYAQEVADYYALPLALITIDPQNRIAGFKDEQSASEGTAVSLALNRLAEQAGCAVLVVDHYGKDATAGLRGTSAKETNAMFILGTGERQRDVYARRELDVRKMRNGPSGFAIAFWMEDREVTIQQQTPAGLVAPVTTKTLTIRWGDELRPTGMSEDDDPASKQQRRALAVLVEMIAKNGVPLPAACAAPAGVQGVKLETWRLRLVDKTIVEGKNPRAAFGQLKNALLDRHLIDIGEGFVWVPLDPGAKS